MKKSAMPDMTPNIRARAAKRAVDQAERTPTRQDLQKFFAIDDLQWDANCTSNQVRAALEQGFRACNAYAANQAKINALTEALEAIETTWREWARAETAGELGPSTMDAMHIIQERARAALSFTKS